MKRLPFLMSLLAVVALSASTVYWGLQLFQPRQRPLAAPPRVVVAEPAIDAAAGLFGGGQPAVAASNYQLKGVVAAGRDSVAIIAADGKPAQALGIGKEVAPGVTVKDVQPRYVTLSEGGVTKRVDLAIDAKAGAGLSQGAPASPPGQAPAAPGVMSVTPTTMVPSPGS